MNSSDQKHEIVYKFILHLHSEKDGSIWKQMGDLSKVDYEAAMSVLIRVAESREFLFSKEDWERCIKSMIEVLPNQQDQESCKTIKLLKRPMQEHSEGLREFVYEICDYEGDSEWDEEEDYRFRVEYVISTLQEQEESDSVSLLLSCSQEQLEGKGWVPNRMGISCCTGHVWTTIVWSDVMDMIAVLLEER